MNWASRNLWLVPLFPLLAAGLNAMLKRPYRKPAACLAILSMFAALVVSVIAFLGTLGAAEGTLPEKHNFDWFSLGQTTLKLGWVLDPLSACMLVMVTFVGLLIFIFSVGYMSHDENFTRFFCFLSLFAAAMLGLIISNSLLLLFMCWELVGLASYLLIGFWYQKPSAAAAAKKAFITTRIGDMGFLLGALWLYAKAGTLLFYDGGNGCLEQGAISRIVAETTGIGMGVSTAISLLIFCGAVGKSGQVPLHVWLPDAMEGPTPVSALIHAATMVAAGVFLVARMYPLMEATPEKYGMVVQASARVEQSIPASSETEKPGAVSAVGMAGNEAASSHPTVPSPSTALQVVTWVGIITAIFAALVAVAQTDIKRILAYSTVSQLGYMMVGLGVGGVAVGMFHLITHAFFKALLFLGAGSVIHGCHEEQDIRRMGGLKHYMPVTFASYAIGMMALSGVPFLFSGFWSKDEILHAAVLWQPSKWPFLLGLAGAFLTAFYMTRQMFYVFFGAYRPASPQSPQTDHGMAGPHPHESPKVMTVPLVILATCTILLSLFGTPVWPWFHSYLTGHQEGFRFGALFEPETLAIMACSIVVVSVGIAMAWWLYGVRPLAFTKQTDPLCVRQPRLFSILENKFFIDELYDSSLVRFNVWWSHTCDWMDRSVWDGLVRFACYFVLGVSWLSRFVDEYVVNFGFGFICERLRRLAGILSRLQNGQVQSYLRVIGVALTLLLMLLAWGYFAR